MWATIFCGLFSEATIETAWHWRTDEVIENILKGLPIIAI